MNKFTTIIKKPIIYLPIILIVGVVIGLINPFKKKTVDKEPIIITGFDKEVDSNVYTKEDIELILDEISTLSGLIKEMEQDLRDTRRYSREARNGIRVLDKQYDTIELELDKLDNDFKQKKVEIDLNKRYGY